MQSIISDLEKKTGGKFFYSSSIRVEFGEVKIFRCHHIPYEDATTFVTLGLKSHLEHEILMHCKYWEEDDCLNTIELLAEVILTNHLIFGDGTTFGDDEELPNIVGKTGFFITEPIYFDKLRDSEYFMALPVFHDELQFIRNIGRDEFKELVNSDETIDLISLERDSFVKQSINLH